MVKTFKSEKQRKYVMSQLRTKQKIDGTVITYKGDVWVGYTKTKRGNKLQRFMNEEEAMDWHKRTGNKVEKL